jgi:phosphotriesterase-related protein
MAIIQSATGPLDTADMGFTLMHEHVLIVDHAFRAQYPEMFDREALLERCIARLRKARDAGVRTMVDLTPIDLGRDAAFIRDAAAGSGMQVIVPTGVYYQVAFRFVARPTEELAALFVRDIRKGIGDSGVRANVIKCATEEAMHRFNERAVRAAARAHRETGVPICTHSRPASRTGLDQVRVFREEGVDLARVVIGHSDDAEEIGYLEEVLDAGAYLGMDRIGYTVARSTDQKVQMIAALVDRGYADRLVLSHDAGGYMDMFAEGVVEERLPEWRWTTISQTVIPMLRDRGVPEDAITQMTVRNPRRIFEQDGSY